MIQAQAEQYEDAEKNIRKALQEFEKVSNQVRVENALTVLADILLHQSQTDEAERILKRLEHSKSRHLEKYKARLFAKRGQYEKAAQSFYAIWEKNREEHLLRDADSTQRMLMEFAATRQEMERLELQEKESLQLLKMEQEQKQQQLKIWILISVALISASLVFDFLRVKRKTSELFHMHRRLREQLLSRFLPPELAHAVAEGEAEFVEKPREVLATVLFASVDGFKPGTHSLPTSQEVELIHDVMTVLSGSVHKQSGTLDKCGGNRVMALFGAPLPMEAAVSAQKALHALREMRAGLQFLNEKWQTRLQRPLVLKAAVHQGKVIVGSFGCEKRMDFTALGLPVQITETMEGSAHGGQCLLAESVLPYIQGFTVRDLGPQHIRGVVRPMRMAELVLETHSWAKANAS
jgi:class 3 adenylate cyclase